MKKVARFSSQTTAHLAKEALLNRGINSEIVGSKEYASIVVGGDHGRYELMVDWSDETEAIRIIKEFEASDTASSEPLPVSAGSVLRKAIVMALLAAVFIPVVFNYASLKNLAQYLKIETNITKKIIFGTIVIALQFLTVIFLYYAIKSLTTDVPLSYLEELRN
ncbi:MAG: DUF2007 domain-containing protein [Bdellovibrionaceae bacterium]|nr:DUF2007 domain-containing protein [Pseudobdellovibrionaceae bacterium]